MAEQIIVEMKTATLKRFMDMIVPHIFRGFKTTYDDISKSITVDVIKNFQLQLRRIRLLSRNVLNADYREFLSKNNLGNSDLSSLLKDIFMYYQKCILIANGKPYNIISVTEIPESNDFIHECYIESAKKLYPVAFYYHPLKLNDIRDSSYEKIVALFKEAVLTAFSNAVTHQQPIYADVPKEEQDKSDQSDQSDKNEAIKEKIDNRTNVAKLLNIDTDFIDILDERAKSSNIQQLTADNIINIQKSLENAVKQSLIQPFNEINPISIVANPPVPDVQVVQVDKVDQVKEEPEMVEMVEDDLTLNTSGGQLSSTVAPEEPSGGNGEHAVPNSEKAEDNGKAEEVKEAEELTTVMSDEERKRTENKTYVFNIELESNATVVPTVQDAVDTTVNAVEEQGIEEQTAGEQKVEEQVVEQKEELPLDDTELCAPIVNIVKEEHVQCDLPIDDTELTLPTEISTVSGDFANYRNYIALNAPN